MNEFLLELIEPVNLHATFLVGLTMLYWIMVIFGAVGIDTLDLDVDADFDLDVDMDASVDVHFGETALGALLTFFHLGQVPVMLVASFFALIFWFATIVSNHFHNPDLELRTAAIWFLPCLLIALAGTKLMVMPIAMMLRSETSIFDRRENLIGFKAQVHSHKLDGSFGEILVKQQGSPLVLAARTENGQRLQKGDTVKIVRLSKANHCIVELAKWESKDL